jgi:hypothetical protein
LRGSTETDDVKGAWERLSTLYPFTASGEERREPLLLDEFPAPAPSAIPDYPNTVVSLASQFVQGVSLE